MGLLDFLSTKPATPPTQGQSGLVVSPTTPQNYSTQTNPGAQVQKSYKDLQYPMPGSDSNQLGTTNLPQADGLQPKTSYSTESLPPISTPVVDTPSTHVETVLDNGVKQVTHAADNQVADAPIIPVESNTPQPLYSYSNNPIPADLMVQQIQEETPIEEPINNQTLPPIAETEVAPVVENTVPGVSVTEPTPQIPTTQPALDESNNGDIIEIGNAAANPVSDNSQTSVAPAAEVAVPEQPVVPSEPVQPEVPVAPTPEPIEVPSASDIETPVVEAQPTSVVENEVKPLETEIVEEPVKETPAIVESVPVESPVPAVEENKQEVATESLKVLNKIAFVSLNSQSVNSSLSKKVKSLAEIFRSMDTEVYIDSNKGYGMDVISGLSGTTNKVTAAYLKPFYSKYSDETTLDVPLKNLTRITFSTVLDRIKFLYKEATVFIVPETAGLNSLSQVMLLLNSQAMYFGTHKPVILFGTAWKEKMNALKTSFALTQQEIDSMYFASTPEEVMSLLTRLDSEFSDKKVKTGFEVDMRDEQGEKEGLLAA